MRSPSCVLSYARVIPVTEQKFSEFFAGFEPAMREAIISYGFDGADVDEIVTAMRARCESTARKGWMPDDLLRPVGPQLN